MLELIRPSNASFPAQKILAYGVPGIGKTSFGATFERPVLLPIEDGAAAINMQSFPLMTSFNQVCEAIQALHGEHQFKTLVVDSLDWLESLVWKACCAAKGWESIETPGYGKGYIELDKWWLHIMEGLDSLRYQKNIDVVILAHSTVKRIEPPDNDPYDCYQLKMQQRAAAKWVEWAETVCFINYRVNLHKTVTGVNQERTRATGTGDRVIYTAERPAYKAKSRWPLPEEILIGKDKSWSNFHQQFEAATEGKYKSPKKEK